MSVTQRIPSALMVLFLASACGGGGSSSTSSYTTDPGTNPGPGEIIATSARTFNPTSLSVTAGTTVTFTFQSVAHTVVFANVAGAPASIGSTSNASVQRVFAIAGTFGFQCSIHPGMTGTVVVN